MPRPKKKTSTKGKSVHLNFGDYNSKAFEEWIKAQDNLVDSIRFLIEREILQHGIRNLQQFAPPSRDFDKYLEILQSGDEAAKAIVKAIYWIDEQRVFPKAFQSTKDAAITTSNEQTDEPKEKAKPPEKKHPEFELSDLLGT